MIVVCLHLHVDRGKMAVAAHPHKLKPLLPREVITNEPSMCTSNNATVHCFQAGEFIITCEIRRMLLAEFAIIKVAILILHERKCRASFYWL
jgi:hypothetical protein